MSNYLTKDDFLPFIRESRLDQVVESNYALLEQVELTALAMVKDALHNLYDIDIIFSRSGQDRDPQVMRWCITLAIYYLYERIPDAQTPERVKTNYEITLETLQDIEEGKKSVRLPLVKNTEGEVKSKFRWGGLPPREHNIN